MDEPILPPSAQPKRFFDVMPPKHTMPNSTSRPLIVGNKSEQEDPMVKPKEDLPMVIEDGPHDTVETEDEPKKVEITPEEAVEEPITVSKKPVEEVPEEITKEDDKSEPEPIDTPDSPPADTDTSEEPPVDPLASEPTTETPATSPPVASEASVAKTLALTDKEEDLPNPDEPLLPTQATPASNEIVVAHHNHRKHNPWVIFILVFIIVILLAVIGDLLLDAGTIKVSSLPHTHFFNK
jgi:hypothetical protein